jgi:hypothetical protein
MLVAFVVPTAIAAAIIWAFYEDKKAEKKREELRARFTPPTFTPPAANDEGNAAKRWVDENLGGPRRPMSRTIPAHTMLALDGLSKPRKKQQPRKASVGAIGRQTTPVSAPRPRLSVVPSTPAPTPQPSDDGFVSGVVVGIALDSLFQHGNSGGRSDTIPTSSPIESGGGGDFGGGGASGSWESSSSSSSSSDSSSYDSGSSSSDSGSSSSFD